MCRRCGASESDGSASAGAPFEVAVPLLDESHLQISAHPKARATALGLVENLLMRVVSHFRPGLVALHLWDVEHLTGPLPSLHPLTRTGILHVHDPAGLPHLLDELSDRIRRVHGDVLATGERTLAGPHAHHGCRARSRGSLAVLVGNRQALREDEHRALSRIARGGLACGVQLVMLDVPMAIGAPVETVDIDDRGRARTSMTGRYVEVEPEPRFPETQVSGGCHAIADEHESWRSRVGTFADLLPRDGHGAPASRRRGCARRSGSPTRATSRSSSTTRHRTRSSAGPAARARPTCCWPGSPRSPPATRPASWRSTCSTSRRACPSPSSRPAGWTRAGCRTRG